MIPLEGSLNGVDERMAGQEKGNRHLCKGSKKQGYAHFNEERKI